MTFAEVEPRPPSAIAESMGLGNSDHAQRQAAEEQGDGSSGAGWFGPSRAQPSCVHGPVALATVFLGGIDMNGGRR